MTLYLLYSIIIDSIFFYLCRYVHVTAFVDDYSRNGDGLPAALQEAVGKCAASRPGKQGAVVGHYDRQG
jgi:hypothetical protein